MTADNCMFWSGEGCICEIETGIRCVGMSNELVAQCLLTNDDLVELEECQECDQ